MGLDENPGEFQEVSPEVFQSLKVKRKKKKKRERKGNWKGMEWLME